MSRPRVEILYFDGCPNHETARELVEHMAEELSIQPQIELVRVDEADDAAELRFLGSPSVRVDGRDVEPDAEERDEFVFSCRLYRSERGFSGPRRGLDPRRVEEGGEVSDGAASSSGTRERLTAGVDTTLAAAGIPASKLGPARRARLTDSQRELYFWILRRFATSGRPTSAEMREVAWLGLEIEDSLATLAREDLVHRGSDGEVAVAYPFSGLPTAHRARAGTRRTRCARSTRSGSRRCSSSEDDRASSHRAKGRRGPRGRLLRARLRTRDLRARLVRPRRGRGARGAGEGAGRLLRARVRARDLLLLADCAGRAPERALVELGVMRMAEYRCTECGTSVEAERRPAQRQSCVGDRCCIPVERGGKRKREEKER